MRLLRRVLLSLAPLAVLGLAEPVAAQTNAILPVDQYTSEKARHLATAHAEALRELSATLYHCMPWLEVHRHSIGFFKPKNAAGDDRYLSVRTFVEQEASTSFARLGTEQRAAAMFSRYVGHLLRRMGRDRTLVDDPDLAGFTVIVEWLKQGAMVAGRPVHETIAVFVDKSVALQYLAGRLDAAGVARRARVLAFDGETPLGEIRLGAWDDEFATSYQVKDYVTPRGVDCTVKR